MGRVSILVLLVGIFAVSCSARCIGYSDIPGDLNALCRNITKKAACLEAYSQEEEYIKASCRWRTMNDRYINETMYLYTRYTAVVNEFNFDGSIAGVSAKVSLAKDAKNRYSVANNMYTGSFKTGILASYNICPAGLDKGPSCTNKWVPPTGYATSPWYKVNTHRLIFNFADQKLINQLKKNASNPVLDEFIKVKKQYRFYRSPPNPKPTAVVDSETFLGLSLNYTGNYQVGSYRAYSLYNVTGVDFSVKVKYQLKGLAWEQPSSKPPASKKAKLTSFIIKASEFENWVKECSTTCAPPIDKAVKYSTICTDLNCKGKCRKMNPSTEYYLFVATPTVWNYGYAGVLSESGKPLNFPYPTQRIKIDVKQNKYSLTPLPEVLTARDATSDDDLSLVGPFSKSDNSE